MKSFLAAFAFAIYGILSGFDRIRFRGTQRHIVYPNGLDQYLWTHHQVLLKDFREYSQGNTDRIRRSIEAQAREQKLEIHYVARSNQDKEKLAGELAAQTGRREGLVAVLSALEPCLSFHVRKNPVLGRLEMQTRESKCLHYYHYWRDPVLGPCHVRLQSWFPFNVFICVNGREMLATRMARAGMKFRQRDNCFSWIEDVATAQQYLDEQKTMLWSSELTRLLNQTHPQLTTWPGLAQPYYWGAEQTEWATDVMFQSRKALARLMPEFVAYSMTTLGCNDVMRFLGHHLKKDGTINGHYQGEVGIDWKHRVEGSRVRFSVGMNGVKFYDKFGTVLRAEATTNDTTPFKSFRASESDPEGPKAWRKLKKGVSDLPRRAEISQGANDRCLAALAGVAVPKTSVTKCVTQVSRRIIREGRPVRALNVWGEDRTVLQTIGHGDYLLNGFRNRDVREKAGLSSSQMSHRLRLLRTHGVIRKVTGTHRYHLTNRGRELIAALAKTQDIQQREVNRKTTP